MTAQFITRIDEQGNTVSPLPTGKGEIKAQTFFHRKEMVSIGEKAPTDGTSCIFAFSLTTESNCCCLDAVYDLTLEMSLFVVTVGSYNAALAHSSILILHVRT